MQAAVSTFQSQAVKSSGLASTTFPLDDVSPTAQPHTNTHQLLSHNTSPLLHYNLVKIKLLPFNDCIQHITVEMNSWDPAIRQAHRGSAYKATFNQQVGASMGQKY